jgi:hypothetical protein
MEVVNNFTNIDTNIIQPTTNQELNDFSNNYDGYLQTQIGLLNINNEKNATNNLYTEEIINKTNIEADDSKNTLLDKKIISTIKIRDIINGGKVREGFENNLSDVNTVKSNTIKFYLYIFIVLIFLYILYYLKKNKHFK